MGKKPKENGSVVKIDSQLLERVQKVISKSENKLKFVNKKHFVDLAVSEYLKKEEENGKE